MTIATASAPSAAAGIAASAAILVVGTAWHVLSYANTDIAWLLTVGEHFSDGAIPYRDIIETNPPGSVLLYWPAILIGRAFGRDPQRIVMVLTGLACAASLAACAALLRHSLPKAMQGTFLAAAAAVLVLLPAGSFGQREHVILLAALPLLCRLALRQIGVPQRVLPGVVAGIVAGLGLAIKPYYALGLVGPALLVWHRAGWRGLAGTVDLWAAGATAALVLGAELLLFPTFTHDVLPLLVRIYLPVRMSLAALLASPEGAMTLAAVVALALVRPLRHGGVPRVPALSDTGALAALGFVAAYLVQGKGWPYQAYPAMAAAVLALAALLTGPASPRGGRDGEAATGVGTPAAGLRVCRVAVLLLACTGALSFDAHMDIDREAPGLADAIGALGPHPRMMSLADDLAIGHPLVRRLDGVWVGTLMSRWIDQYAANLARDQDPRGAFGAEIAFEDRTMASDIRDRHPDAVLASAPTWAGWIAGMPATAAALAGYRPSGTYGSVTLWVPKPRG